VNRAKPFTNILLPQAFRLLLLTTSILAAFTLSTSGWAAKASVGDKAPENHALKLKNDMVWIKPAVFWMGSDEASFEDTRPVHQVRLNGFWLDKTLVTNEQFASFVRATGYKTVAEEKPKAQDFPGAPAENLVPGALVFTPPTHPVSLDSHYQWWRYVAGANWKHPQGPNSNLTRLGQHPVVQIAWDDAVAYCKWLGKRLPTESEFECAARGGLDRKPYSWGDQFKPGGKWQANIWQGDFPLRNAGQDGYLGTNPVTGFPPNKFGLYDMTGNVWEWCSDWYRADYYKAFRNDVIIDSPKGPIDSLDPLEKGVNKRVLRGGSFLCTDQYCNRYLVGARGKGEPSSGCSNIGFRCAKD
jgi:sulfatase modifying factor 1